MTTFEQLTTINSPTLLPSPIAVVGHHHLQLDTDITHLHSHQGQVEIAYCHQGQGVFLVGNEVLAYGPGDVVIVPSGTAHAIQSVAGTTSDWYFNHFNPLTVLTTWINISADMLGATDHWWHFPRDTHPAISDTTRLLTGEVANVLPYVPGHTSTTAQGFIMALLYVGFSSQSSFNRQFQYLVGTSPSAWRQQQTLLSTSTVGT